MHKPNPYNCDIASDPNGSFLSLIPVEDVYFTQDIFMLTGLFCRTGYDSIEFSRHPDDFPYLTRVFHPRRYLHPEKDIGIQKIKKTSFGLEVSVI
jgi:hypothetical protein